MSTETATDPALGNIHSWKSILTLIVFILTNAVVVFPFNIPIYVPNSTLAKIRPTLVKIRVLPAGADSEFDETGERRKPISFKMPINFVTMPVISVLFLICLRAIGRREVHDGTLGADNIVPIDIMAFFLTLAYLAISIDATGLIRFLAFWVLRKGGAVGHRLYFLLYLFFFGLGTFIGNDPIILSGTAFLAYLTRVSANIKHPRAWIYAQFAAANISSAILVSSNPTNLVLSGAFKISFVTYTANMVVPVIVTAIVLFPFLLYIIFPSSDLIPYSIDAIPIPQANQDKEKDEHGAHDDNAPQPDTVEEAQKRIAEAHRKEVEEQRMEELNQIVNNPFMDKKGAWFGGILLAACLTTLLVTNATGKQHGVWTITVPSGTIMLIRDIWYDWGERVRHRELARKNREKRMKKNAEKRKRNEQLRRLAEFRAKGVTNLHANGSGAMIMSHGPSPQSGNALELSDEEDQIEDYELDYAINPHPLGHNPSSDQWELGGVEDQSDADDETDESYPKPLRDPPITQSPEYEDIEAGSYFGQPITSSPTQRRGKHGRTATKDSLFSNGTGRSSPRSPTSPQGTAYPTVAVPQTPNLLVVPPTLGDYPIIEAPPSPSRQPKDLPSLSINPPSSVAFVSEESDMVSSPVSENSITADKDKATTENTTADGHADPHSKANGNGHALPSPHHKKPKRRSVVGAYRKIRRYLMETFPTVCAVIEHLPFALIPFAFSMFILVQGLVTKGWVQVFANGWDKWVVKTGTIGAVGGMGFVSVCLCNFAGTNIGTSILISRVLQAWFKDHAVTDRIRDASVYALALGVNFGAFSAAFNASLAGLLWRDILARKHITVRRLDFARINLPIIAISMSVGCGVLAIQVYLVKHGGPEQRPGA